MDSSAAATPSDAMLQAERLRRAERACRAWGRWLHAVKDADPESHALFAQAQVALRDWWATVKREDA